MTVPAEGDGITIARGPNDEPRLLDIELVISYLLRGGVLLSIFVILVGVVLTFLQHPGYVSHAQSVANSPFLSQAAFPSTVGEMLTGIRSLHGDAIALAGLLILLATPILRVAVSIVAFALEHDLLYVWITSFVLTLLIVALFLGKAGG